MIMNAPRLHLTAAESQAGLTEQDAKFRYAESTTLTGRGEHGCADAWLRRSLSNSLLAPVPLDARRGTRPFLHTFVHPMSMHPMYLADTSVRFHSMHCGTLLPPSTCYMPTHLHVCAAQLADRCCRGRPLVLWQAVEDRSALRRAQRRQRRCIAAALRSRWSLFIVLSLVVSLM